MPVLMELAYNQAHALVMLAFMDRLATENVLLISGDHIAKVTVIA